MQYVHSLPAAPAFKGKGLLGYTFGPLAQKDLDLYYIEVEGGHDTFMISWKITRTYYILSGAGYFTIDGRQYDATPGMVVEVPPKVEYTYSGRMRMIGFSTPGWAFGNDRHTRWNADAVGEDCTGPLPNGSWRGRILWWRVFGRSPVTGVLVAHRRAWRLLPAAWASHGPLRRYGAFLHRLARAQGKRGQAFSTFFLRNRPLLDLLRRVAERQDRNATLRVAVLGCSTGAEVYSIAWAVRTARPDLELAVQAVDVSREAVEAGARGRYSLAAAEVTDTNVFERVSPAELAAMFDRQGDDVVVKPWLREGIAWRVGDAGSAELLDVLGPQDIVIASNFLCHMDAASAEACLRAVGRLAAPGGYVVATGVDLEVRSTVAEALGWSPVQELLEEIHDGDPSLRRLWPCHYAGLEPLDKRRPDWRRRYAAAFRTGAGEPRRVDAADRGAEARPVREAAEGLA